MPSERAIPHRFSNWIYPWRDTVFYGWYRVRVWSNDDFWSEIVKNKQVKQMMADGYDKASDRVGYWCQRQKDLIDCARFMRGEFLWWPKCGVISLTAYQLRGVNDNH